MNREEYDEYRKQLPKQGPSMMEEAWDSFARKVEYNELRKGMGLKPEYLSDEQVRKRIEPMRMANKPKK